eukprot:6461825-Prymnesium_polylepis.1
MVRQDLPRQPTQRHVPQLARLQLVRVQPVCSRIVVIHIFADHAISRRRVVERALEPSDAVVALGILAVRQIALTWPDAHACHPAAAGHGLVSGRSQHQRREEAREAGDVHITNIPQ